MNFYKFVPQIDARNEGGRWFRAAAENSKNDL
ncbi:Uncharacterised protein [Streptococcus downei MFe28]|uniref:Uncharacterized protein n=1 Tax=Streptococcus downei MFe28 TaxID=764290 RepID=A0A380JEZ6_STRDO|nr:Uncharacterised protein [Streptococcus downei MFe28]